MAENNLQTTFMVRRIIFNNKCKEGRFQFAPEIGVGFNKIAENKWETIINVKVIDKPEQEFPFDLDVIVSLISFFPSGIPEELDLKEYLKKNSINILFPYVRSIITNVTSAALVSPLYLPITDANKLAEKIDIPSL